jgi:two-component system NarL family sensor kinase
LLDTGPAGRHRPTGRRIEQRSGLTVTYNDNEFDCQLVDGAAVSLFRIVQEGLTNIERHAQAKNVSITLHGSEENVRLTVVDDGVGFNVAQVERRHAGMACVISVNVSNILAGVSS